ncbi:MAG: hypothetical protein GXO15_00930, partial [Crenarchaeota archaeon]|nr:hypothetical protein [Thermoproteota archaeon]
AEPLLRLRRLRGELRATDPLRLAGSLALAGSRMLCWHSTCFAHVNTRENLRVRGARSPLGEGLVLLGPGRPRPLPGPGLCGVLRREERLYRGLGLAQLAAHASRDLAALCG